MNDYQREFLAYTQHPNYRYGYDERRKMMQKYAFSIPCDEAIDAIVSLSTGVVSIGAGTGYWEHLLEQRGMLAFAFDHHDPSREELSSYSQRIGEYHTVRHGDETVIDDYPGYDLFLNWPPYDSEMATNCLRRWIRGIKRDRRSGEHEPAQHVFYIGESEGGCTADDRFFRILWEQFTVHSVDIPQWDGIHDRLYIAKYKLPALG